MTDFKFNPIKCSQKVQKTREILCINNHFFIYKKSGVFEKFNDLEFFKIIMEMLGNNYKERWAREIRHCVSVDCFQKPENVNKDKNVRNI